MESSRVAVTGLGAITALGLNVNELWASLISGKVGYLRVNEGDTYPIGVIPYDHVKRWHKKFVFLKGEN